MRITEAADGKWIVQIEIEGDWMQFPTNSTSEDFGKLHCIWEIDGLLDCYRRTFRDVNQGLENEFQEVTTDFEQQLEETISKAEELLCKWGPITFQKAQFELMLQVFEELCTEATLCLRDENGQPLTIPLIKKSLLKEMVAPSYQEIQKAYKQQMGIRRGGARRGKADLTELRDQYDRNAEDWHEAYQLCRAALASRSRTRQRGWQAEVKRAFPNLPDDLIERLQPVIGWPDEITTICSEQGGGDTPEDIALEHAARLCGAGPYAYKLTSLQTIYRKQKREFQTEV